MEITPQENADIQKQGQDIWQAPTDDEMPGVSFLTRHKWLETGLFKISIAGALLVFVSGWLVCLLFVEALQPVFLDWLRSLLSPLIFILNQFWDPMWFSIVMLTITIGSIIVYVSSLPLLGLRSALKSDRRLTMALGMTQATAHAVVVSAGAVVMTVALSSKHPKTDDHLAIITLLAGFSVYLPAPVVVWLITRWLKWTSRQVIVLGFWINIGLLVILLGIFFRYQNTPDRMISLMLLSPLAIFTVTAGIVWALTRDLHQHQLRSMSSPTCRKCGYDLIGSLVAKGTHCPECGVTIPVRIAKSPDNSVSKISVSKIDQPKLHSSNDQTRRPD